MARIRLKGGQFTRDRRLDRLVSFDERSRAYPIRPLLTAGSKPRKYTWNCEYNLDQGQDGACVGFSVTQEAGAKPVVVRGLSNEIAYGLYRRAQQLDEWPGEDYEGSSVLAGMKAAQERGWNKGYRWGFGIDDDILAVGYKGPLVNGIVWYEGMFNPDEKGFVSPGVSKAAGGHAIVCIAVDPHEEFFVWKNSWGKDWGIKYGNTYGCCKISFKDYDRLRREDGEGCIPTVRTQPKAA